jgi:hypothetical protein
MSARPPIKNDLLLKQGVAPITPGADLPAIGAIGALARCGCKSPRGGP